MDNPYQPPSAPETGPDWQRDAGAGDQRPTAVTVFGILNIIFGALGLLCSPFALLFLVMPMPQPPNANPNPALELMKDPGYRSIMLVSGVLGIVAAGALLAAGIGLLKLAPWGRTLSIAYACYAVVSSGFGMIISYIYLIAPLMKIAEGNANPAAAAGATGGVIGGAGGAVLGLIYPILLLFFMTRPRVVQAFRKARRGNEDLPTLDAL